MNKAEELITCLEGEIAKRDARIVELEADLTGTQSRVLSLQNQWRNLDAELAEINAQGVRFCNKCGYHGPMETHNRPGDGVVCDYMSRAYAAPVVNRKLTTECKRCLGTARVDIGTVCDNWVDCPECAAPVSEAKAQGVVMQSTDGGRNPRYEGLFDGETEEQRASRLNAAHAQQVSVPASAFASRAITHYEAALLAAFPSGSSGEVFNQWNEARRVLAAAPAAPAADAVLTASEWTKDADEWGGALNYAAWEFINECPEKSALLFNNTKVPLRAAIMKYAELVAASAKEPSHD